MQEMEPPEFPTPDQRERMLRMFGKVLERQPTPHREYFVGPSEPMLFKEMERRRAELEAAGFEFVGNRAVGRNEPCPCGSGRKFKRCCLRRAVEILGKKP